LSRRKDFPEFECDREGTFYVFRWKYFDSTPASNAKRNAGREAERQLELLPD